jgi:hypothetical protein
LVVDPNCTRHEQGSGKYHRGIFHCSGERNSRLNRVDKKQWEQDRSQKCERSHGCHPPCQTMLVLASFSENVERQLSTRSRTSARGKANPKSGAAGSAPIADKHRSATIVEWMTFSSWRWRKAQFATSMKDTGVRRLG